MLGGYKWWGALGQGGCLGVGRQFSDHTSFSCTLSIPIMHFHLNSHRALPGSIAPESSPFSFVFTHRRLLIFPKGNKAEFLSLYLDVPDTELLPQNWQRAAGFKLSLIDQVDGKHTFVKGALALCPPLSKQ
jgi:hypothetical protein